MRSEIRQIAPKLAKEIDEVCANWLSPLINNLEAEFPVRHRPKQVNDPIWGTIELLPWEVAFLDTPLLQRLRGVRQLGLAQFVFPGANHGRLEHTIGVVGAVEQVFQALSKYIDRWNRKNQHIAIQQIDDVQRYAIRLAALFHDIGHGPFSHALEPVLEITSPLDKSLSEIDSWRAEIKIVQNALQGLCSLNKKPSVSVTLSVMMVLSEAMHNVLCNSNFLIERSPDDADLSTTLVKAIIGAVDGEGSGYLSAIVSSQVDADRMDYLRRDAHHSGLEIGFDTERLLAKLEVLRVREDNLPPGEIELRNRASEATEGTFFQLGIAASGFGSFEQMLIGRTFLYDRLYHHHKVRAAEAMAQRLMLVAERDRGKRLTFQEVFLPVGDDTMLQIFAGHVTHSDLEVSSKATALLAKRIINRDLLHRAYAFRGRFISTPPGLSSSNVENTQNEHWARIEKSIEGLDRRYQLGVEIFELAVRCLKAIKETGVDTNEILVLQKRLEEAGAEQIIVDIPASKTEGIRLLVRYPNGAIRVPEFSFNPQKWSEAYDLQKRTGYVFCPREIAPAISLASKIIFLVQFGVVMIPEADGYIKAKSVPDSWLTALVQGEIIDNTAVELLQGARHSLLPVRVDDINVPDDWIKSDPDLATKLAVKIQETLSGGLTQDDLEAFRNFMRVMFIFIDNWFSSSRVTESISSESELQKIVADHFRACDQSVKEGMEVNGGETDLFVCDAILIENKFSKTESSSKLKDAGSQGRRYAIALDSQVVCVLLAQKAPKGSFPQKQETISIHKLGYEDKNRMEVRVVIPFGAVKPSREKLPSI